METVKDKSSEEEEDDEQLRRERKSSLNLACLEDQSARIRAKDTAR